MIEIERLYHKPGRSMTRYRNGEIDENIYREFYKNTNSILNRLRAIKIMNSINFNIDTINLVIDSTLIEYNCINKGNENGICYYYPKFDAN